MLSLVVATLTIVSCIFLGVITFANNPAKKVNRLYAACMFFAALWIFANFTQNEQVGFNLASFLLKLDFAAAALGGFSFLYFCLNFPNPRKYSPWLAAGLIAPAIILAISSFGGLVFKDWQFSGQTTIFKEGILFVPYALYFIGCITSGTAILFIRLRTSSALERNQILYTLTGVSIPIFIALAINLILSQVIALPASISRFAIYSMIVGCAIIAFAITKQELMDIRVVIGRTAAYGASIVTVMVLGAGTIYLIAIFHNNVIFQFVIVTIFAFISVAIFEPIRNLVQTPLLEKWITGWYNSEQLLNNIAKALGQVSGREEAFKVIAACLKDTIKIKSVGILLGQRNEAPKPDKYILIKEESPGMNEAGSAIPEETTPELSAGCPFIAALTDVIHFSDLKPEAREVIKEYKYLKDSLYLPLFSTGVLEGIIVLGQKKSEDPYNKKDYALMRSIIIQARAILDRILNYETIKKDFDANQKKLYETDRLLARSEKIASLARLIQEYNHEIKTPLAIIKGETEALTDKPRDAAFLEQHKNLVLKYIDKADDIVRTTLRLGEPKEQTQVKVNLNDIIARALKLYPPSGVHLITELNPVPDIAADKDDLETAFVNIIRNANEAMPEGGDLKISTYSSVEDEETTVGAEVTDTGIGIPEENLERIFEPFFSTHVTKGRGLGLSTTFRIIREHLGRIEVKSKVGAGSTFKVQFRVPKK